MHSKTESNAVIEANLGHKILNWNEFDVGRMDAITGVLARSGMGDTYTEGYKYAAERRTKRGVNNESFK
jgi:hypothetical protein